MSRLRRPRRCRVSPALTWGELRALRRELARPPRVVLRHAAGALLAAPDDHWACGRLRAAVGAYDRARAEWGGES